MPPVAAVYVNAIVLPLEPARTEPVSALSVPEPSAAFVTVIDGEVESAVSVPLGVDFSIVVNVCTPVDDDAVAFAYVTVTVPPEPSVSESTVTVWPETETELEVTWPAPAPVWGVVQPAGTSSVSEPLARPPVAAV